MSKIKVLFGLTVMVGLVVAITAASASALFTSTSGKDGGQGKAGKTVFTDQAAALECESFTDAWKLTKGKIGKETVQVKGAENVDLHINALHAKPAGWEKCRSTNALGTLEEASECELQIRTIAKGQKKATFGIVKPCVITISGCTIELNVGENFKEIINENKQPNELFSKINVNGLKTTSEGTLCDLGGIKQLKNNEAELKGEATGVGQLEE
jgi:hypothetical protein